MRIRKNWKSAHLKTQAKFTLYEPHAMCLYDKAVVTHCRYRIMFNKTNSKSLLQNKNLTAA